jgi:hypothetical protein
MKKLSMLIAVSVGVIFFAGCNREKHSAISQGVDRLTGGTDTGSQPTGSPTPNKCVGTPSPTPSIPDVSYTFSGQGTFNWPGYPVEQVSMSGTITMKAAPGESFEDGGFGFYRESVVSLTVHLSNGVSYTRCSSCEQPPADVKLDKSEVNFQQNGSTQDKPSVNMSMHFVDPRDVFANPFEHLDGYQTITFNMSPDQANEDVVYRGTINQIRKGT